MVPFHSTLYLLDYFWHEDFWENIIKITAVVAFVSIIISLKFVSYAEYKHLILCCPGWDEFPINTMSLL